MIAFLLKWQPTEKKGVIKRKTTRFGIDESSHFGTDALMLQERESAQSGQFQQSAIFLNYRCNDCANTRCLNLSFDSLLAYSHLVMLPQIMMPKAVFGNFDKIVFVFAIPHCNLHHEITSCFQ